MKTANLSLLLVVFALCLAASAATPKNIVLFIGDGMSTPQRMTADEFARKTGRAELVLNRLPYQATTRTCSASSLVTDSAAAATAIACGEKTYNGAIGVNAATNRLESAAEFARRQGRRVGIVTTVTINHATPAGFYGHRKNRGMGYELGLDLIASGFDYFAGGGLSGHSDKKSSSYKGDIYDLAKDAGYTFVRKDRAAFDALKPGCGKVWYVATDAELPFSIDTGDWEGVPTLAELTAKGLELLENEKGFFMMVEGGKIDYAGHANDAATNLRELLALDDAVRVAVDYQKKHPDTLVVVTGDHETGGMTMGFAGTGYSFFMDRLAYQKCSAAKVKNFIRKNQPKTFDDLRPFLEENFGLHFDGDVEKDPMTFTKEEKEELDKAFEFDLKAARKGLKDDERYDAMKISRLPTTIKSIFSHKCGIGWTSGSHTALPVLTTAGGPGAERFGGFLDNTDISRILKELLGAPCDKSSSFWPF